MIPFYFDVFSSIKKHVEYTLGQQYQKINKNCQTIRINGCYLIMDLVRMTSTKQQEQEM